MAVQFKDGLVLFEGGSVAMDPACCCGGGAPDCCSVNYFEVVVDGNGSPVSSGTYIVPAYPDYPCYFYAFYSPHAISIEVTPPGSPSYTGGNYLRIDIAGYWYEYSDGMIDGPCNLKPAFLNREMFSVGGPNPIINSWSAF